MKALVISDDDKSLGVIDSILQTNGIDSINYKWLIKALDNVEEIRPDLIIINVLDYPRHWKTLAQFVRSTFEDSIKILLYVPESFSSDEYKKAAELGIESCFSSFDDFAAELPEIRYFGKNCPPYEEPQETKDSPFSSVFERPAKSVSEMQDEKNTVGTDNEVPTVSNIVAAASAGGSLEKSPEETSRKPEITLAKNLPDGSFALFTVENLFTSSTDDFVLYTCDSLFEENKNYGENKNQGEESKLEKDSGLQGVKRWGSLLKRIQGIYEK